MVEAVVYIDERIGKYFLYLNEEIKKKLKEYQKEVKLFLKFVDEELKLTEIWTKLKSFLKEYYFCHICCRLRHKLFSQEVSLQVFLLY